MVCKECGSEAINEHMHGRTPGTDSNLCDVCYWRVRAALPPFVWRSNNKKYPILYIWNPAGMWLTVDVYPNELNNVYRWSCVGGAYGLCDNEDEAKRKAEAALRKYFETDFRKQFKPDVDVRVE